ncbi:GntR family transcriptional regulator [Butyricicoccus sp. Marseille-Q5471]|uniref:GntR family transcriptional regulator n=1 Tax=Butyricicoccus sp. Marseille-Q5471 TaxID=3039493 RepID=UPI0024BD4FB9|nr:GntR family transcriptional regulator [Butyricicoccus sp. Marseille-Q5471]
MALKNIKKEPSLADRAYVAIKASIISNELAPGAVLAEETLADQLGISRTPIRAALQRLLFEEIVVQRSKNLVVSDVTQHDVRDVSIVRVQLEPLSARLIGQNGGLTQKQLERLHACNDKQVAAAEAGGAEAFLEQDYLFHIMLAQLSGNSFLVDLVERSNLIFKRFHTLSGTLMQNSVAASAEHHIILDALSEQDFGRAELAIRHHLENVNTRFFGA